MRANPSERLIERLRTVGLHIPIGAVVERTHAGRVQRAQGAWSWFILMPLGPDIGSQCPVTELLRGLIVVTLPYHGNGYDVDPLVKPMTKTEKAHYRDWMEEQT